MRQQMIAAVTAIVLGIATTAPAQPHSHEAAVEAMAVAEAVALVLAAEVTALATPASEAVG
jgi:hypothetical protein